MTKEQGILDSKEIILCGGGNIIAGELKELDSQVIKSSENKKILVLDLTTNNPEKINKYKLFLKEYFLNLGATEVKFISEFSEIKNIDFNEFGIIYLPGGDPITLLENIIEKKVDLRFFRGILFGNSAGALVLSKNLIVTKDEDFPETFVKRGLGIIPFSVEVHYDSSKDSELEKIKLKEDIYAIPEKDFIKINQSKIVLGKNIKIFRGDGDTNENLMDRG
jgi:dipeptidase E